MKMTNGSELIAEERQRQIDAEGWTPEHDDMHDTGQLAFAAACYADYAAHQAAGIGFHGSSAAEYRQWPWDVVWWKPSANSIRNLVKAGALIAAEIDRQQRRIVP
jgi:hypothetical protein